MAHCERACGPPHRDWHGGDCGGRIAVVRSADRRLQSDARRACYCRCLPLLGHRQRCDSSPVVARSSPNCRHERGRGGCRQCRNRPVHWWSPTVGTSDRLGDGSRLPRIRTQPCSLHPGNAFAWHGSDGRLLRRRSIRRVGHRTRVATGTSWSVFCPGARAHGDRPGHPPHRTPCPPARPHSH